MLNYLKQQWNIPELEVMQWYHHWLQTGFDAFEEKLKHLKRSQPVCLGEIPSLADICLIPQVYNAKRFHFSMDKYPLIEEINAYCLTLPPFKEAVPE